MTPWVPPNNFPSWGGVKKEVFHCPRTSGYWLCLKVVCDQISNRVKIRTKLKWPLGYPPTISHLEGGSKKGFSEIRKKFGFFDSFYRNSWQCSDLLDNIVYSIVEVYGHDLTSQIAVLYQLKRNCDCQCQWLQFTLLTVGCRYQINNAAVSFKSPMLLPWFCSPYPLG